ncbi:MAG: MFS transporter [Chloroflexi bacterium]|nr:MFS transporter [Chloroflexota bacterium]
MGGGHSHRLSLLGDATLYTVLPTHTGEAGIVLAGVGVMLSANRWVRLGMNGVAGWLLDQRPRRHIFIPALFIGVLSNALVALGQGYWPLLVARLLWGTAWSGIWVAGNAIVLDVSHEGNRGRNIGYYNIAFFSGAGAGSFIGGVLTDWLGYHGAMGVAAALAGLGALVAFFVLPETKGEPSSPALLPAGERARVRGTQHISLAILTILALLAVNRLIMAGMFFPTFGLYLREVVGETVLVRGRAIGITTLTGFGLGLSTFLGMWFGLGVGHWSDRVKNRWGVAAAGLIPGIVGFLTLALGPAWGAAVAVPLNSMTSGSNQGMATVLLGHEVGEGERGRWLGTLFTVGDLASATGPLLTFALLESVALVWLYILAAILLTMMFALASFTAYRMGQKTAA